MIHTLLLDMQGPEAFRNELELLSNLDHPHLVKLQGCCVQHGTRCLVYELMPSGNLLNKLRCEVRSSMLRLSPVFKC